MIGRAAALQGDRLEGREGQGLYSRRLQGLVKVIEAQRGMVVMVPGLIQLLFMLCNAQPPAPLVPLCLTSAPASPWPTLLLSMCAGRALTPRCYSCTGARWSSSPSTSCSSTTWPSGARIGRRPPPPTSWCRCGVVLLGVGASCGRMPAWSRRGRAQTVRPQSAARGAMWAQDLGVPLAQEPRVHCAMQFGRPAWYLRLDSSVAGRLVQACMEAWKHT